MASVDIAILGDKIAHLHWWESSELYRYLKHAGCQDELIPAHIKPVDRILYFAILEPIPNNLPKNLTHGTIHGIPT